MPVPQTSRGQAVTGAEFTAAFETPIYPCGAGGLNLIDPVDNIPVGEWPRLTNVTWLPGGSRELTSRPGQTQVASAAAPLHSIVRMNDPQVQGVTYLWGGGSGLYKGVSGALTLIESGFSGDPLTLLPHRPTNSGDPWTFVGDSAKMCKIRYDGLVTEIGLQAPAAAAVPTQGTQQITPVAVGTTTGDAWTAATGETFDAPPLPVPPGMVTTDAQGVTLDIDPPSSIQDTGNGYYTFFGMPKTLNLNMVGAVAASDDDIMQMSLLLGNPASLKEARIYLVCSAAFSPTVLPGQTSTANTDYYVKAFRPDDFNQSVSGFVDQINAAETARVRQVREAALQAQSEQQGYAGVRRGRVVRANDAFMAQRDPVRNLSVVSPGSQAQYIDFGTPGIPLRRGDWKRYGNTTGCDWSTITGIIVYIQLVTNGYVTILNWNFIGGSGPDTSDPGAQSYDYRITNYDPRTGAESNPSPEQATTTFVDSLRRTLAIPAVAYGDSALRQRFYRRGGFLTDNWYYAGENSADGGTFEDTLSDLELAAADTVEIDHYQPVATVDDAGETVLAQPVPILFGPYNSQLFGLGDPYRPGFVYASLPGEPDHWPPDLTCEVCPPSEELMNGGLLGNQPFVFSRSRPYALYVNLTGTAGLTSSPTGGTRGLVGRWAFCSGAGSLWGVANDGIWRFNGGDTPLVSDKIRPLFQGQTVYGYLPIDFTVPEALRLAVYRDELYFGYQDTDGDRQVLVYQILTGQWRHYQFGRAQAALYADGEGEEARLLLGGASTGLGYELAGFSDDGLPIEAHVRSASWDWGRPREEKLLGDQIIELDPQGLTLSWSNFLNNETVENTPSIDVGNFTGRQRVILDSFGDIPQRARNLAVDLTWSSASAAPTVYYFGTSFTPNPDITMNRVTNWDDCGSSDPKYVMGVTLDCDTGGGDRTVLVEADFNGTITTLATLTVNTDGRHKVAFSWLGQRAMQVRLRPTSDCGPWILFRADWNTQQEPSRIATWDAYFDNGWDQYYTGLDLYCDTGGATKQVAVTVDGVTLVNPETSNAWWDVTTAGRQVVHLTLPTGRGHVFRFYALDANVGTLYQYRWHLVEEPSEQHNWNAPYTILGTQADKWLKALVFEVDTFGEDKTVAVEADGVVVDTLTVNANGRKVVQLSLTDGQKLGRVWRIIPTDSFPSRLYTLRPVFDEEPFSLTAWNTQLLDHGFDGYHYLVDAMITLKSNADVTLTLVGQYNQASGATFTDTYTIPSTGGEKRKVFLPFEARKAVLYQYFFDTDVEGTPFWLYREESFVHVRDWQGGGTRVAHPFGNDDADPSRGMVNSTLAAERSGGAA